MSADQHFFGDTVSEAVQTAKISRENWATFVFAT